VDNRDIYLTTAQWYAGLVERVPPDAWAAPALGVWDVRGLVGHTTRALTTVVEYAHRPADTLACETATDYYVTALGLADDAVHAGVAARGVEAGAALGDDPAVGVRRVLDDVTATLATLTDTDVVTTIAGGIRVGDYLATRVVELAVHGVDLCDALGLPFDAPEAATQLTLEVLADLARRKGRAADVIRLLTGRGGSAFTVL
jgi:uncharacterized protein (TIGR03083 family)